MAASQQKKRLISSSLHEHYRAKKKKKLDSSDYVLNLRSQIYLEWNDSQKKAVAKREQIGLTWTDMTPFVDFVPQCRSSLADVFCVPQEIYSLNNLMEVLSYEVWATCLSESERKLLTQFLPSGTGTEQAVHSLLSGEDHHFGNPFLRWSTLLCSGNLHPDGILRGERKTRSNKKKYYSELKKYHTDMLEGLKKWKDRRTHCNDPEKLWRKTSIKPTERTLLISSERAKEIPQKIYIHNGDIAKYMSYIKISKKQHEAIKNLKHSGDGIQTKTLSRVLGDISSFQVHPYEALEEEEKIRLREHRLQIVNRDLPMASEAHKEKKLQREQFKKCLEQELSEKRKLILDKIETENSEIPPPEKTEGGESGHDPVDILAQKDVISASINSDHGHQLERIPSLNSHQELSPKALDKEAVGQDVLLLGDNSPDVSQFNGKENLVEGLVAPKPSNSPGKEMWQAVNSTRYSSNDLSLKKPEPVDEHRAPMIDLKRDVEQEGGESDDTSLFSLYAGQGQDGLQSFTKGPEMLPSYPSHEHVDHLKQPGLQFLMANGSLSEAMQFPPQFQEQHNIIEQRHVRGKDHLYMRQMMNKSIYSNGRYPSHEFFSSANGDLVEHNRFPNDDHQTRNNCWPGIEPSSNGVNCLGDIGNSDGSLFSVLSACRNMPSQSQYNNTNTEQLMESKNFGPSNDSVYGYVPHEFKSSNSHESAAASTTSLNIPWMNYQPHQNSNLQDSIRKPFVRSWNQ